MVKTIFWVLFIAITLMCSSICLAEESKNDSKSMGLNWGGNWADGDNTFILEQNGNTVTGTHVSADYNETIELEGNVSDDGTIFSGVWRIPGMFIFTLSDDGTIFNGTAGFGSDYSIEEEPDNWNGTLSTEIDSANPWAGTWITGLGATQIMKQDGDSVTGIYNGVSGDYQELNGTVSNNGKELSGQWIGYGKFIFTLSDDAMVFNGTYGHGSNETQNDGIDDSWNGTRIEY